MKCFQVFGFCVYLFGLISCYTEEDVQECQDLKFGVVQCSSVSLYRECDVPGAIKIYSIKLHMSTTRAPCEFTASFGFRGNSVWVTEGCSGQFYICYDGTGETTRRPRPSPVTKPYKTTTPEDVAIKKGSTVDGDTDVWIYVIIASCVVLLVGIGLIVGCVVKRRQQNDKSRQLAEKRQIRIELKEHRDHMEENGVTTLPLANRSLSVESISYGESVNFGYGSRTGSVKEGSICSSRSSTSGMTSSTRTTGYLTKARPSYHSSMRRVHNGMLKKGISTPDISVLGRMYCEANMTQQQRQSLRRHSKSSVMRSSQNSLESVKEVCGKYQVFEIPIERQYQQRTRRPAKYNTVSVGVGGSQRAYDSRMNYLPENDLRKYNTVGFAGSSSRTPHHGSMTSLRSSNRRTTQPMIHSRSPSEKDVHIGQTKEKGENSNEQSIQQESRLTPNGNSIIHEATIEHHVGSSSPRIVPRDTQYHDPTSLIMRPTSPGPRHTLQTPVRPESPVVTITRPETIYQTVNKPKLNKPVILPKPKLLPKPNNSIYATVNKSYFKAASKVGTGNDVICPTFDIMTMEDDEDDVVSVFRESQYARLEAFKPASLYTVPVTTINIPGISTDVTNI